MVLALQKQFTMAHNQLAAPEILWAIDFDRTLVDGDVPDMRFMDICAARGIDRGLMLQAKSDLEAQGGSFDVMVYLRSIQLTDSNVEQLCEEFISQVGPGDMFLPGATGLLDSLAEVGACSLILTYGGTLWQLTKMRACGLTGRPYLITSTKNKGELIRGWSTETGYEVAADEGTRLHAAQVTLVDDKASSFAGLPVDCLGYLIRRRGVPLLKSQLGDVPDNVSVIANLDELNQYIS